MFYCESDNNQNILHFNSETYNKHLNPKYACFIVTFHIFTRVMSFAQRHLICFHPTLGICLNHWKLFCHLSEWDELLYVCWEYIRERQNCLLCQLLENRTKASQKEMDQIDSLEELREMNTRKNLVNTDEMIDTYRRYEKLHAQLQLEMEEKEIK